MNRNFDDLQVGSLELFCLTVEQGSFTAAAISAGLTPAAVSRAIARMESRLGVKLFIRSTRQLRLSEAGQRYYYFCRQAIDQLIEAEKQITGEQEAPSGLLRISVPTPYAHFRLLPIINKFHQHYPEIKLEIHVSNRNVDLTADQYDLVIRGNHLPDSSLIARKLEDAELCIVASPEYLAKNAAPTSIQQLQMHECIQFEMPSTGKLAPWLLNDEGQVRSVDVKGSITCKDDFLSTLTLVKTGLGLMQVYRFTVAEELRTGTLKEVLVAHGRSTRPFFLLYPASNYQPLKMKVFIDFILKELVSL
ncbi:LysR family transcriptional regulator [Acinetobacter gyllenbergii]|uniref:LysR family transcriptional regulator n=1 Tax=Acinetobacter gyllenbergii TaxID=134534 RepID=UPI0008069CE6|nr:LysR family transcriptional regulator [Acinetobacter gyllenbergii]OBY75122.1 LysR family transcriptional regulator [Acinetobacter gyllenbergii]